MPTRPLGLLAIPIALIASLPASAQDYPSLISKAREQLEAEQFVEGLATAKRAIKLRPKDHKGYYYAALALYKADQPEEAEPFLAPCRTYCPPANLPAVERLAKAVTGRRKAMVAIKAGDEAVQAGFIAKAAQSYQAAWEADDQGPEMALKAAGLYADRLSQPTTAAPILREVVAKKSPSPAADSARAKLASMASTLNKIARESYEAAMASTGEARVKLLKETLRADPEHVEAYAQLTYRAALLDDGPTLEWGLQELAKRNALSVRWLAVNEGFAPHLKDPAFLTLLGNILGPAKVQELQARVADSQQKRREITEMQARKATLNLDLKREGDVLWTVIRTGVAGLKFSSNVTGRTQYGKTSFRNWVRTTEEEVSGHPDEMSDWPAIIRKGDLMFFQWEAGERFRNLSLLEARKIQPDREVKGRPASFLLITNEEYPAVQAQLVQPVLRQKQVLERILSELSAIDKKTEALKAEINR